MASLSLLFNHFLTYPKHSHAHTHRGAYINIARCNFHVYAFWRTRTHTHAEPKKGKKQRYQWCDTIPRMPGQNWSVAHAFDVNPEHGHVTNADTKLHPVLLWSLNPHTCFYRGNKIVYVCVCVCGSERECVKVFCGICAHLLLHNRCYRCRKVRAPVCICMPECKCFIVHVVCVLQSCLCCLWIGGQHYSAGPWGTKPWQQLVRAW